MLDTRSQKFENAAQFILMLGLPSAQIRHENGAFQKRSSNRKNSLFNVDEEHFENGAFQKR